MALLEWITYHVDDHLSKCLPLFLVQIAEDVAIGTLQKFERHCQMVVLQYRFVVIHESQFGTYAGHERSFINEQFYFPLFVLQYRLLRTNGAFGVFILVLIRNWLVRPGWSTSWMVAAKMAAMISRLVNTDWTDKRNQSIEGRIAHIYRLLLFFLR